MRASGNARSHAIAYSVVASGPTSFTSPGRLEDDIVPVERVHPRLVMSVKRLDELFRYPSRLAVDSTTRRTYSWTRFGTSPPPSPLREKAGTRADPVRWTGCPRALSRQARTSDTSHPKTHGKEDRELVAMPAIGDAQSRGRRLARQALETVVV
jgi:hypothetical protein